MTHLRDCVGSRPSGEPCGRKETFWPEGFVKTGMPIPDPSLCSLHAFATEVRPGLVHPGIGTGAIVLRSDDGDPSPSLLMVLRKGKHGDGTWSVPGGWVEKGEDIWRSAEREVLEETGVVVGAYSEDGWTSARHTEGIHAITLWMWCHYRSGEPTNREPDKASEVAWIPVDAVADRPLFQPFGTWWSERGPAEMANRV